MTSSVTLVSALKRIAAAGGVSEPSGQGQAYVQRCIRAARNDVGCHQLEVPQPALAKGLPSLRRDCRSEPQTEQGPMPPLP